MNRPFIWAVVLLLVADTAAHATLVTNIWTPIFKGIEYNTGETDSAEPVLQKVYALRVDLRDPDVELFSTPSNGFAAYETDRQTTTQFVSQYGLQVAINANFFSLDTFPETDLLGLAVSRGEVVSPAVTSGAGFAAFLATSNNQCSFQETITGWVMPTNIWTAVAGSTILLRNGVIQSQGDLSLNPRTALGLSKSNEFLIMIVIDGRQPGYSDGSILTNTAAWLLRFGAWNGLNLDGGGSTTMVKQEGNGTLILNKPSGGIQRANGNALGVFSRPIPPGFARPPQNQIGLIGSNVTFSAVASGTTPLRYQWQFNGVDLAGATTNSLTFTNVQTSRGGIYALIVTNALGTVTSAPVTLDVHYGLNMIAGLGGIIVPSPNQNSFPPGAVVSLEAQPDPGFVFTGWSGDASGNNSSISVTMDGHKTISATFAGSVPELILDNTNATFIGTWQTNTISTDKFGPDYCFPISANSTATYRPTIFTPGQYAVYLWYPQGPNRTTNAPWEIAFDGGNLIVPVNQRTNGGKWLPIAPGKNFARGTNGFVRVSNSGVSGVVIADAVKFVFGTPPSITNQPQNLIVRAGTNATFDVGLSGSQPFSYQWTFNGTNIPGATLSTLTRANAQASDAGIYNVIVTNLYGATTSVIASLTVHVPPSITSQPQSQSVPQATNVTFAVTANGSSPLYYQWRFNGADIPGANNSSLILTNVQMSDAGNYSVLVTNFADLTVSSDATLTISPTPAAPFVARAPQNQTAIAGRNVVVTAQVNGTLPLYYQWRFNGNDIAGANGSALTLANVQPGDSGNYSIFASNNVGNVTSSSAALTVNFSLATSANAGGSISQNPNLPNYSPGSTVTLTAVPDPGFAFTGWSGDVSGTNNPLTLTMSSNRVVNATFFGSVSDIIIDNNDPRALFTANWSAGTTAAGHYGTDYRFANTVVDDGQEIATYRPTINTAGKYDVYIFFPSGSNRSTNATWITTFDGGVEVTPINQTSGGGVWRLIAAARPFAQGTNGYVRISNETGELGKVALADAVKFSYLAPPQILTQPSSQTIFAGANATFSVSATGANPMTYQWQFNGADIPNANAASLVISNAQSLNAGSYSVMLSNISGSLTSASATLTIVPRPAPVHFDEIAILADGTFRGKASGDTNIIYAIEASPDLLTWVVVTNVFNQSGTFEFIDPEATSNAQRFYRARCSP